MRLVYTALLVGAILAHVASAQGMLEASADPSGRAREAAATELSRLSKIGSSPFKVEASSFEIAELGVPFLYYAGDHRFLDYEQANPHEILRYVTWRDVCFPVRANMVLLGIMRVEQRPAGEQFAYFTLVDRDLMARLETFSKTVPREATQRLSILSTGIAGDYFVVEDGVRVYQMAPTNRKTLAMLGLATSNLNNVTFSPLARFSEAIRKQLEKSRKHVEPKNLFEEELEPLE